MAGIEKELARCCLRGISARPSNRSASCWFGVTAEGRESAPAGDCEAGAALGHYLHYADFIAAPIEIAFQGAGMVLPPNE
jgi:hypothetical protein